MEVSCVCEVPLYVQAYKHFFDQRHTNRRHTDMRNSVGLSFRHRPIKGFTTKSWLSREDSSCLSKQSTVGHPIHPRLTFYLSHKTWTWKSVWKLGSQRMCPPKQHEPGSRDNRPRPGFVVFDHYATLVSRYRKPEDDVRGTVPEGIPLRGISPDIVGNTLLVGGFESKSVLSVWSRVSLI